MGVINFSFVIARSVATWQSKFNSSRSDASVRGRIGQCFFWIATSLSAPCNDVLCFLRFSWRWVIRFFSLVFLVAVLAGCATQELKPVANKAQAWQQYQQQWQTMPSWQAKGQMSLVSPQQALMSNFQWQAHHGVYHLRLYGALGIGQIVIDQSADGQIYYTAANGKKYQAQSAKLLMQKQLGWSAPLTGLAYWVRGVPAPNIAVNKKVLNQYGLLSELKQSGWSMRYYHYIKQDGLIYPARVVVTGHQLRIVVALSQLKSYTAR